MYMDDLSFEEFEIEYKYLKAVIEGGLETKPDNVLIYATSNRRHLIRETWGERKQSSDDVHGGDSMQEKLSLATRFGETIYYGAPSQKEYVAIAKELARRFHIRMDEEAIAKEAVVWEMRPRRTFRADGPSSLSTILQGMQALEDGTEEER